MNLVTVAGYTACSRRFSHFGTYNISLSDTVSCWRPLPPQLPTSHDLDFQTWWNLMWNKMSAFSFRSPQPWQTQKCGNKSRCVGELTITYFTLIFTNRLFLAANKVTIQVHTMAVFTMTIQLWLRTANLWVGRVPRAGFVRVHMIIQNKRLQIHIIPFSSWKDMISQWLTFCTLTFQIRFITVQDSWKSAVGRFGQFSRKSSSYPWLRPTNNPLKVCWWTLEFCFFPYSCDVSEPVL